MSWRVLRPGDGDLVLAVDFFAPGRVESSFADLAAQLVGGCEVWETVQPQPGDDRVDVWLDAVGKSGRRVVAVFGYCVGAVYAAALAKRLAASPSGAARLVLFDPEPATVPGMLAEFHAVVDRMAPMLRADELADLRGSAARAAQATQTTPERAGLAELAEHLLGLLRSSVRSAFDRAGVTARYADEVAQAFGSVLSYIVDAAGLQFAGEWASATVIGSRPFNRWASRGKRLLDFDLSHAQLLGSPAVAGAVGRLLNGSEPSAAQRLK